MIERTRMGRIGYLNVLPIYHPLESGLLPHNLEFVSGPPAELNRIMDAGGLDISSCSSVEYARRPGRYLLVPDLAIGSRGPVQSVLLLSRRPVRELHGRTILVSAQTHTSATLLRVLLAERYMIDARFVVGDATAALARGERPEAILAIGDEALNLRKREDYPEKIDLGEEWRSWTDLPFIFGVWIVQRDFAAQHAERARRDITLLLRSRDMGMERLSDLCALAAQDSILSVPEMCSYFDGLAYGLGREEQEGLELFFSFLERTGQIPRAPELNFMEL